jgi:hypothetical protein
MLVIKMVIKAKARKPANLYWVETDDHGEDWFIARSARGACRLHEDDEGYAHIVKARVTICFASFG